METLEIPPFNRLQDYFGAWAIEPSYMQMLADMARKTDMVKHIAEAKPPSIRSDVQIVKAENAKQVAVVMLTGSLMKSASSMSSGTSTIQARREIRQAVASPDVSSIMLAIDSPGGTVSGTADLAAEILQARKSKPVYAFIDDLGASAAYWLASQCEKIFANNLTALVGSIGTIAVAYDYSEAAAKEGIKTLVFSTGPLKGAGAPGTQITEEQQAYYQSIVDDAQVSFDAAVKKGRGMTDSQLSKVKSGGVFGASEALSLGLIDGIKGFDAVVNELAAVAKRQAREQSRAENSVPQRGVSMEEKVITNPLVETATSSTAADVAAHVASLRAASAAEMTRQSKIAEVCKGNQAVIAQAIAEGWTPEKAELTALRASLANNVVAMGPHFITGATKFGSSNSVGGVGIGSAMEAALSMSIGSKNVEKDYKPEVLEAAHSNFRNMGLQQMILLAASHNGYRVGAGERITNSNIREVYNHAFSRSAGASVVEMSGILGNVANKEIVAGYMEEDMTWQEVSTVKPVSNFQQHTVYRMLDNLAYEEVGPDGKIKHGTASQESYTRQAKTYAKMFALTRLQIINDDLGAFQDIRSRLGRGQAMKFNDLFWTNFLANHSTFFTSTRTNYITGATTTLLTDGVGLGLGVKAFRQMVSPSGDGSKRVNSRPSILLIPPELESAARSLYVNENLATTSAVLNGNIFKGLYRPVVNAWLSDSAFTGYSTTAWYLFSEPSYLAPMVVSFLNGNQTPTVESADADFDTLGIQFRGYHDFGCDQAEYLAGVKSKGAA